VARLAFRAPELIAAGGIGGLSVAGIAAGAFTGEWRWAVTGFAAGAALPVIGLVVMAMVAIARAGALSEGHLLFAALLLATGVPGVVLGALWTGNIWVLPIGLGAIIAMAGFSAFNAASAALRGDLRACPPTITAIADPRLIARAVKAICGESLSSASVADRSAA
jgi:hypothetical protein